MREERVEVPHMVRLQLIGYASGGAPRDARPGSTTSHYDHAVYEFRLIKYGFMRLQAELECFKISDCALKILPPPF